MRMNSAQLQTEALRRQSGDSGPYLDLPDRGVLQAMDPRWQPSDPDAVHPDAPESDALWQQWGTYWMSREQPRYYVDPATYADEIKGRLPHLVAVLLSGADQIFSPEFHHATYRPKREGRSFRWVDQVADSAYCGLHYMFFIRKLGRAYLLTRDPKYPAMFREIVCSWWDALPELITGATYQGDTATEESGVHLLWNGGLGSSTRCLGMLECYYLMRDSSEFTPELHRKILRIFLGHSRYIYDNHVQEYSPSNFQATATCWLVTAGIMLPEFTESGQWLEVAVERLKERAERNFETDGAQVEQCPQYHLAGMRDLVRPILLMQLNGCDAVSGDADLWRKLQLIFEYPVRIAHATGHFGLFNSGVYGTEWQAFLPLGWRLFRSPLLGWAAARFIADGFVPVAKHVSEYVEFMNSDWVVALEDARSEALGAPSERDDHLEASGVTVIRSGWDADAHSLVLDHQKQPWGGHAYPGRLSFDLFANGVALVVNPGSTASYSMPQYRNWYHQTISHNTVLVNGHSQARPHTADLEAWHTGSHMTFVSASTRTYAESDSVIHQRCLVAVRGDYYLIVDWLRGGVPGTPLAWLLHTPLDIAPLPDGTVASPDGAPGMVVVAAPSTRVHAKLGMDRGFGSVPVSYHDGYDPSQAWRDDVPFIRLDSCIDENLGGQTFGVVIAPFAQDRPNVYIHEEAGAAVGMDTYTLSVETNGHTDTIHLTTSDGRTDCTVRRGLPNGDIVWAEGTR